MIHYYLDDSASSSRKPGAGGTPHIKVVRMLVGNFELNP